MATADFTHTVVAEGSPPFGRFVENNAQIAIDTINVLMKLFVQPSDVSISYLCPHLAMWTQVGNGYE